MRARPSRLTVSLIEPWICDKMKECMGALLLSSFFLFQAVFSLYLDMDIQDTMLDIDHFALCFYSVPILAADQKYNA